MEFGRDFGEAEAGYTLEGLELEDGGKRADLERPDSEQTSVVRDPESEGEGNGHDLVDVSTEEAIVGGRLKV